MSVLTIRHGFRLRRTNALLHKGFSRRSLFIGCCFLIIASISSVDIWFAVQNSSIMKVEQNPICLALMKLDPHNFTYFIAGKASGTLLVITTLLLLHRWKYRHALTVTVGVALFQLGLLTYLTLSDPTMYHLPNFSLLFRDTHESIWELNAGHRAIVRY